MPVIFAENFQQDTSNTLLNRYPGTYIHAANEVRPNSFPIDNSQLEVGPLEFGTQRLEIMLGVSTISDTGSTARVLNVFGIPVTKSATAITYGTPSIVGPAPASTLNFVLDPVDNAYMLTVLVDQVPIGSDLFYWYPNTFVGGENAATNNWIMGFPKWIDYIVVASETEVNTVLSSASFFQKPLTLKSSGNWSASEGTLTSAVDKPNASNISVSAGTTDDTYIEYEISPSSNFVTAYVGAGTDLPTALEYSGKIVPTGRFATAIPANRNSSTFKFKKQDLPAGAKTNGDGVTFFGERTDLITYTDLSLHFGITAGNVMNFSGTSPWLDVMVDSTRMFVSKVPVRNNITFVDLYYAGVAFDNDYELLGYTFTPQGRTITLEGKLYKCRLLHGVSKAEPLVSKAASAAYNPRSEWDRIFGALCASYSYYNGVEKLAVYTDAQVRGSGSGGVQCWTQSLTGMQLNASSVVFRGGTSQSIEYLSTANGTLLGINMGWRPVLELLQD